MSRARWRPGHQSIDTRRSQAHANGLSIVQEPLDSIEDVRINGALQRAVIEPADFCHQSPPLSQEATPVGGLGEWLDLG